MPVTSSGRHYNASERAARADLTAAARTASGQSTSFNAEDADVIEATLSITTVSGTTPTLDLKLQTSMDGTTWDDVGAFPQKTAAGTHTRVFSPVGNFCRWVWTIGGTATPTFNFSVSSKAKR